MESRYRIGVDVGGTHTDLVLLDTRDGSIAIEKVSTTPHNPAEGVLTGVSRFLERDVSPADVEFFAHGTTITTNALLEMRGARVGLMISAGYRAIQEVQNQARDGNPFDYFYQKPEPIAPQSLTREIPERVDYEGNVLTPLDGDAVRRAAAELREAGCASIAVCYLFSYMNPAHERETRRLIQEAFPEAYVSLSSEVLPRIREWPRLSTTLLNAYLEPVLVDYIASLADGLDAVEVKTKRRFLMQSNGGVMPFAAVATGGRTVQTLLSGPAAGARASAFLAGDAARTGLVTLDMGGTSCDIAFIAGGEPLETTESTVARRPVHVPALDLTTISAGGGSIAWVDRSGLLTVGPRSAGAMPGPVCYGRGGGEPTVTDADLVCGFLNPDYFLGGAQGLDVDAAGKALDDRVAGAMGMSAREAAVGIRRIVDMRMADEVRVVAAKRGVDADDFTLLPFGGAGAVHAAAVAEELNMRRILVPPRPGAFSALGLLCTDVIHDYVRSELRPLDQVAADHAEAVYRELEDKAAGELADEGLNARDAAFQRELDLRYVGQGYELRVPVETPKGGFTAASMAAAREAFDAEHARIHGHAAREKPVELVSYRMRARVDVPKYVPVPFEVTPGAKPADGAAKGTRAVWFEAGAAVDATIYERDGLPPGCAVSGPAIIEQLDSTTVVPPGWTAEVDAYRNLILVRGDG